MKLIRFYRDSIQPGAVRLDAAEAHHLGNVLRLKKGQQVELFDGKGTVASAVITTFTPKAVMLEVRNIQAHPPRTDSRVIIAAGVAKARRFDWLITKCTELGVDHIAAVTFDRTVKQPKNISTSKRYANLTIAAAKQCGRTFLPKVTGPENLAKTLALLKNDYPNAKLFFGGSASCAKHITDLPNDDSDIIAFIGPEGGMTTDEENLLKDHHACRVRLTDTILRIETAAIAFAAVLCAGRDTQN